MPLEPFAEDTAIARAAEATGMRVYRRPRVLIDPRLLAPELFKRVPDYARIEKLLRDGAEVPGAQLSNEVEYVLTREPARDVEAPAGVANAPA